jgi:hypothetical protein
MAPLEQCLEDADKLSQEVVKVWQESFPAINAPEFQVLLDKAFYYQSIRKIANYRRQIKRLRENDEVEVKAARLAFAKAYMALASVQIVC